MRTPFVAGNWKMNLTRGESVDLARALASADLNSNVDVAVCPPFVYLEAVQRAIEGSGVKLGAQDVYHEQPGAFTGEISTSMLKDLGCHYVILGHSERRNVMGESNETVNKKVNAALNSGLIPIVCVGELLQQREAGKTMSVIEQQFDGSLAGLTADQVAEIVIAYEPVWAIGTGKVASPEQAEEVHAGLRALLADRFGQACADAVRIQYGGSVKPDNAAELMSQPNIDGALVGGAALKADGFVAIVQATGQVHAT